MQPKNLRFGSVAVVESCPSCLIPLLPLLTRPPPPPPFLYLTMAPLPLPNPKSLGSGGGGHREPVSLAIYGYYDFLAPLFFLWLMTLLHVNYNCLKPNN
jgi:hypothetical protein